MNRVRLALGPLSALSLLWFGCSSSPKSGRPASETTGASASAGGTAVSGAGGEPTVGVTAGGGPTTGLAGSGGSSPDPSQGGSAAGAAASDAAGAGGAPAHAGSSAGGAAGVGGSGDAPVIYPTATTQHRAISIHDPSMIHVGSTYYLFGTGGKLNFRSSTDFAQWGNAGTVFTALPGWIGTELGQTPTDLWAPDISFVNGTYRVYYAGSVFGSNHSVIGLATNKTLDQKSADYAWVDQGLIIESNKPGSNDNWNAIDPNFILDEDGNSWLVFGSFWSGIKLLRLDDAGKASTTDTMLYGIANHASGGVEAPSIVFHGGYYYLFVSYDACCKGVNSTYRTMVGRATAITGPYSDNTGKAMLQGNALQLLATDGRYIGQGGGTAFRDGNLYYYVYHYYDGDANGASFLMMRPIGWTADGWPALQAALWQ